MKTLYIHLKIIFFLALFLLPAGCGEKIEEDPCQKTQWPQSKEYEIKLAVHISTSNPSLPGGSPGSQNPSDFVGMVVNGTIEKVECDEETSGPINLGNSYVTIGVDYPAPIDEIKSYWIGHVVYVYEYDNDKDYININLTVKITMQDEQSYSCNVSKKVFDAGIDLVPGENYYYILIDVNLNGWVKV
jgi:hypothetical protein